MFIDLKKAILEALTSREGRDLLREMMVSAKPAGPQRTLPSEDDRLLTAKEAATLLGMTERALRQAAHRGSLPAVHVGRRLRFRRFDLLKSAA